MGKTTNGSQPIKRRVRPLIVLSGREERELGPPAHAIAEQARRLGWDLLDLRFTKGSLPDDRVPSGALIAQLPTEPLARQLRKIGCPAVRLGRRPHPRDTELPTVLPDVEATGRLAAEHFAERGFHHVGYIARTPWSMTRKLYQAFRAHADQLGCACHLLRYSRDTDLVGAARYDKRAREFGAWLEQAPKPIGVLVFSDSEAATVCTMCRRAGFAVPEDVAVLGIGNQLLDCETAPVALSSIDPAHDRIGEQAVQLLQQLMRGKPVTPNPVFVAPHGVIARRSTDVLAVNDPNVARAMRFMWDHLDQNLSVDAIAREVGVQRRRLERAFRTHLKRGVNAELRRKRLERCCDLLRGTDITITDIAPMVGFRSDDFLHASFKKTFGMTPRQYRLRHR